MLSGWYISLIVLVIIVIAILLAVFIINLRDNDDSTIYITDDCKERHSRDYQNIKTKFNSHDLYNGDKSLIYPVPTGAKRSLAGNNQNNFNYIWRYDNMGQYKPIVPIPDKYDFIKLSVIDQNNQQLYGSRLPLIYGQDRTTGLYRNEKSINSMGDWINIAPGTFSYTYPNMPIPTTFYMIDHTISSNNDIYLLYRGETAGPGSLQNIYIIVRAIDKNKPIHEGERLVGRTGNYKLVTSRTNRRLQIDGYRGTLYGVIGKPKSSLPGSPYVPLNNLNSLNIDQSNESNIILSMKSSCHEIGSSYELNQNGLVRKLADRTTNSKSYNNEHSRVLISEGLNANGDVDRLLFHKIDNQLHIDSINNCNIDMFTLSHVENYYIIDYDLKYDNGLQLALLVKEKHIDKHNRYYIYIYDLDKDQLNRLNGYYNEHTRLSLTTSGLYIINSTRSE